MVGASGFEPPTSWSRTRRSSQAEPRPEAYCALIAFSQSTMGRDSLQPGLAARFQVNDLPAAQT